MRLHTPRGFCRSHFIVSVFLCIRNVLRSVFAYGYLDALRGKRFAQGSALDDAWELLRAVNLEGLAVRRGKNGGFPGVELAALAIGESYVNEAAFEAKETFRSD